MTEFYQGILACATMLGGLCAFIYWVFNLMEKRLEMKIDVMSSQFNSLSESVRIIADEVREERKRTDHLYMFVLESVNKKEKAVKK
jgi:hypothetical protein